MRTRIRRRRFRSKVRPLVIALPWLSTETTFPAVLLTSGLGTEPIRSVAYMLRTESFLLVVIAPGTEITLLVCFTLGTKSTLSVVYHLLPETFLSVVVTL